MSEIKIYLAEIYGSIFQVYTCLLMIDFVQGQSLSIICQNKKHLFSRLFCSYFLLFDFVPVLLFRSCSDIHVNTGMS